MRYSPRFTQRALKIALCLLMSIGDLLITSPALARKPPRSGRPTRTAAGGHRGQCPKVAIPLTAIVPLTEARTISPHPTFWFYSPYTDVTLPAKFTLQNNGEPIAELTVKLPKTPGIIRVQLPNTANLEIDKSYEWLFEINCEQGQMNQPPIVIEGSVQRVMLDSVTAKKMTTLTKNSHEQVAFYVTNGLWLDAATSLIDLRLMAPQDKALNTEWQTFLRSLTLEQLVETPVDGLPRS